MLKLSTFKPALWITAVQTIGGEMDAEIFLTTDEARDAVCLDLEQYGLQEETLLEMADLAGGEWPERFKALLSHGGVKGEEVVALVETLINGPGVTRDKLCGLVSVLFWSDARPIRYDGEEGLAITTDLDDFQCLTCGECCRNLDYSRALIAEDLEMWRRANRQDILAWVGRSEDGGYTIWVNPETGEHEDPCPFLTETEKGRFICGIHELKPSICREYPATKKHGFMTGCAGVEKMFESDLTA